MTVSPAHVESLRLFKCQHDLSKVFTALYGWLINNYVQFMNPEAYIGIHYDNEYEKQ